MDGHSNDGKAYDSAIRAWRRDPTSPRKYESMLREQAAYYADLANEVADEYEEVAL